MKTFRVLSLLSVVGLALAACQPAATPTPVATPGTNASGLSDLGGREIRIAVENAYNPFNYIDEATGQPTGYDYELFREACKRLNCKPTFVQTSWDAIVAVMSGAGEAEFDVAADGITITPERAEHVDFSTSYISIAQRVLVRADETRFASAEELKANPDLKVGAQPGTTNYDLAKDLVGESRVVSFDQYGLIIQALINGDVDATMMDDVAGVGYLGANPDKIKIVGEPLTSEPLGFVFPKGSDLRDPINQVLTAMEADGTLAALKAKWFPGIK